MRSRWRSKSRADAGRMRHRGDRRQVVQEAGRCGQGRRAAGRARDRQGDGRGSGAGRRRAGRDQGRRRAARSPSARCSALISKDGAGAAAQPAAPRKRRRRKPKPAPGCRAASRPRAAARAERRRGKGDMPPRPAARKMLAEKGLAAADVRAPASAARCSRRTCRGRSQGAGRLPGAAAAAAALAADARLAPVPVPVQQLRAPSARQRRGARGARAHDAAAPDHRAAPQGCAEHRGHADDVQRRRHERGHEAAQRVQGAVREAPRREARLHGLLREGLHPGAEGGPGRQRRDRRRRTSSTRTTTTSASPSAPTGAWSCRWCARPTACRSPRSSRPITDFGKRARDGKLSHRGDAGRHLHHHQRRRLRLAAVDADPQRAAVGHSRHAPHRGARRGARTARSWPGR